jgi:trans-aconitate methyltransferase
VAAGEAWRDAAVAERFARERAAIVPEGRGQLEVLLHVLRQRRRPVHRIADLGCGDGVLLDALLTAFPEATGMALDYSEPMRALAARRLAPYGARATVAAVDLRDPAWAAALGAPPDVVVSAFAIHHLPDARKRALYGEIQAGLAAGGTFLNLEHVASPTQAVEALHDEAMVAFQAAARARAGETVDVTALRADYHARPDKADNILAPVEAQCAWLRAIGFVDVDVFWKWFELALFGGAKPCS